jgi:hypothetical protein
MSARRGLVALWLTTSLVGFAAAVASAGPPPVRRLTGTLRLSSGSCAGGQPTGSYLAVTFGTRAIRNKNSSCDKGAVTLLQRGHGGLSTQSYSPAADASFDGHGNARSDAIAAPASFNGHELGLLTAARNLQDAPDAAPEFRPPTLYLIGNRVVADLRSLQILYNGFADSSCASASGYGCWLVGAERATGTYDAATHRLSLSWFSGQSFTPASAGTEIHLVGTFVGEPHTVSKGTTVELGTASFAAGAAQPVADRTVGHASIRSRDVARRRLAHRRALLAASSLTLTSGSPPTFLAAELIVELNLVAFCALAFRRRQR